MHACERACVCVCVECPGARRGQARCRRTRRPPPQDPGPAAAMLHCRETIGRGKPGGRVSSLSLSVECLSLPLSLPLSPCHPGNPITCRDPIRAGVPERPRAWEVPRWRVR